MKHDGLARLEYLSGIYRMRPLKFFQNTKFCKTLLIPTFYENIVSK